LKTIKQAQESRPI